MTFGLVIVLTMLIGFISYIVYLPFLLFTGFSAMSSADTMADPAEQMRWAMTGIMIIGGVANILLMPFLQVPLGLHALSLIEEKEGRGLMDRVDELQLNPKVS